jgi:hypothetical protein
MCRGARRRGRSGHGRPAAPSVGLRPRVTADRCGSRSVRARTRERARASSSAMNGGVGVMRCHSRLRAPGRHGTMRRHTFLTMSVRTAMDVAISGRMQGGLSARPSSLVGLNGAGTSPAEVWHRSNSRPRAYGGPTRCRSISRRDQPDNGSQVLVPGFRVPGLERVSASHARVTSRSTANRASATTPCPDCSAHASSTVTPPAEERCRPIAVRAMRAAAERLRIRAGPAWSAARGGRSVDGTTRTEPGEDRGTYQQRGA